MQEVIKKEQKRLDATICVIDELLEKNKQNMNKTAKDVVEAQLIAYAKKEVKKLQDLRPNPYFGRLDFEDEFGKETIYIGKKGIEKDGELIVVDWRTDLGRLYNAYQGVQKTFQIGKENRPVTIHGKRGIVIKNGKVIKVTDIGKSEIVENENGEKVKYMDDYLKEILTNTEEAHRLRDIIASIQAEQDEIIRLPLKDTIIVQGAAGSGKSTIALHRISYLLYQYHEQVKPKDILILAPNEIFLSYIKDIVPEIEIEGIEQRTFYDWASTYFTDVNDIPDLHEQYVHVYGSTEKEDLIKIAKYKGSLRFKKLLDDFVEYIGNTMIPHGDIVIESGVILSKEEIHQLYHAKEHLPLNVRMKEVKEFILNWSNEQINIRKQQIEDEFEEAYRKWVVTLPEGEERKAVYEALEKAKQLRMKIFQEKMQHEISLIVKKMENIPALLMYKSVFQKKVFEKFHPDIDEELLSLLLKNGRQIKQEHFMYEDIAPLIYLDAKINGKKLQYEHIVIDEAQDYSPFQLAIMKDYAKSMTILGDIAQGIFSFYGLNRWEEIESYVFKEKEFKRLHLQTSYRSTKQIMDLANRVLLNSNYDFPLVIPVNRPGAVPTIKKVESIGELYDEIVNSIRLFEEKGYKKIAILTASKQGAIDTYDQLMRRQITQMEVITEGHQALKEKIVIIPSYLVKGLEFDAVIIEDVSDKTFKDETQHAKMLYMSITRAHHDLHLFYRGNISPLLEERDPSAPPKPRKSFADWLITDINDPYVEPQVEAVKRVKKEDMIRLFDDEEEEFVEEAFEDDRERYYDFHDWLKVWRRWAETDEVRPVYRGATLAPWPNRVVDGRYAFRGDEHQLALTEPERGHALHGLLAWSEFADRYVETDRVVLTATIEPQSGYPFRVGVEVEYRLDADGLAQTVRAHNLGADAAPWGTGPHPYLVAGAGRVDDWVLTLPASEVLTVTDDRLSPVAVESIDRHPAWDFREPRTIGDVFIDHAFTTLAAVEGAVEVRVAGTNAHGVAMRWDERCPWVQVHTADHVDERMHRRGLAVEPMTCPPDAFNSGVDLTVLEPGAGAEASWRITAF